MDSTRVILLTVGVLFLSSVSLAQIDCTGLPDGPNGYGCKSYTDCSGGIGYIVDCPPDYVFDVNAGACRPIAEVPPPCGSKEDCSGLADGRYPVMPDCRYYYTCTGGVYMGSNPCNDPPDTGDLVFDSAKQICNWIWDVLEPCGTYLSPTVPPRK